MDMMFDHGDKNLREFVLVKTIGPSGPHRAVLILLEEEDSPRKMS